jgi:hypothetical protein
MPVIGVLLMLAQIACAVHAGRTGRPFFWIYLIIFVPMMGMLAYFAVEIAPELLRSRTARTAAAGVGRMLDPEKDYREALRRVKISETVETKSDLAALCVATKRYDEASTLYREVLTGLHATDPSLLLGLARAEFGRNDWAEVQAVLEDLREANPEYRSAEGHLLYARALEQQGKTDAALYEYEALIGYYPGQEAKYRYALLLKQAGRVDAGNHMLSEIIQAYDILPRHARREQKEWVDLARRDAGR